MSFYSSEPLPLNDLFKDSWDLYTATLKNVWIWSFLNTLLFVVIDLYNFQVANTIAWNSLHTQIYLVILSFIFLIPWSFLRTGLMVHMHNLAIKHDQAFLSATLQVLKEWPPIYLSTLLYQLVTVVGLVLLIVPGIYFGILFFMYLPAVVFDKESVTQSFVKSAKLTYGSWWETLILMIAPSGLIYIFRELMRSVFIQNIFVLALIVIVLTFLLIPYSYALLLVQYNNLKNKKVLDELTSPVMKKV